jgi:hypothetical protein
MNFKRDYSPEVKKELVELLTDLMEADEMTGIDIGFVKLMRVDSSTFKITGIDQDQFAELIKDKDLTHEINLESHSV